MNSLLEKIPGTNCYLDDLLVVSKGSFAAKGKKNYVKIYKKLNRILTTLNKNMAVKFAFFQKETESLGFKIFGDGLRR